jgi:hypothetical protein
MPIINNYGSLKTELSGALFHSRFAANYDRAVTSFEAVANRRLRTRRQENSAFLTTSSLSPPITQGSCDLPSDYLLWRTVLWTGRSPYVELDYVHPAYLRSTWIETDHGDPKVFTIEGDLFFAAPVNNTTAAYEFHYYRIIDSIVGTQDGDNGNNWLINDHPDLYLEGALTELFILARNGEAAIAHKQLRDEKFAELIQLSALTTGATSPSVRTADYF